MDFLKMNRILMKKLMTICMFLASTSFSWAEDIPDGAINYFASKYGHKHPDTLQIVKVDFGGNGSQQFLMTFAKDDWDGPFAVWGVVEFRNGHWTELNTLDADGEIKDSSALALDPTNSSFIYLPAYKAHGLITRFKRSKGWIFTYLLNNVIYNVHFWTASQAGLDDDSFRKLLDANKIVVQQRSVQQ